MSSRLYSIRMRASLDRNHISGAERLIYSRLEDVVLELISQALNSCVLPDSIYISVDTVDPESVTYIPSLDIRTIISSSCEESLMIAEEILKARGISTDVIEKAFDILQSGPSPDGGNMRGGIIMDTITGNRMEPDKRRGVRVSRIDYSEDTRLLLKKRLRECGIYHRRVMDALAIATKVSGAKETIAELCWSDDPDYTTGYVASQESGYVRITNMKEKGISKGGRVFFVKGEDTNVGKYIEYLERQPVIIDRIGEIMGVGCSRV